MDAPSNRRIVGAVTVVLFAVGLGVFITPFAFPTPPPIVKGFTSTRLFSPNGDARRDVARIAFRLNEAGTADVAIMDPPDRGGAVRKVLLDAPRAAGVVRLEWDGTDTAGNAVPDGRYVVSLRARSGRKQWNTSRSTVIDRVAPPLGAVATRSAALAGPGEGECRVSAQALERGLMTIEASPATGGQAIARSGPTSVTAAQRVTWLWDGKHPDGRPVSPGLYVIRASLADRARNAAVRETTCWVGHGLGTAVPARPKLGERIAVRLTDVAGTPLPGSTRVTLQVARRTGDPGGEGRQVVGRAVGAVAAGPLSSVRITIPRQIPPRLLWVIASTPDMRVLIPLRP